MSAADQSSTPISCRVSEGWHTWQSQAPGSAIISTYQAGKVAFVGWNGQRTGILLRDFERAMGLSVTTGPDTPGRIALATRNHVHVFADAKQLAGEYPPPPASRPAIPFEALYLPRLTYYTSDLNLHDLAFTDEGLLVVNTRFSCLSRLTDGFAFEPVWQPKFISELTPEDRCHLNGVAVRDGKPTHVTALGESDTAGGWRPNKADGGVLMDVRSGEVVLRGLCMPHSPRWHQGELWFVDSGRGTLCRVDLDKGRKEVVAQLAGYLRGLCFVGSHALVGLCKIREKHIFGGLPVQQSGEELKCRVALVELESGKVTGTLDFTSGCEEIYDVQWLPDVRRATILNTHDPVSLQAIPAPEFGYWMLPQEPNPGA